MGGDVRACRFCGCTDRHACPGGCSWISEDQCSRCGSDVGDIALMQDLAGSLAIEAAGNWPAYNSAHEGFAVVSEEFDELKAHVWTHQSRRDLEEMRVEALQLAASAIRFAADICNEARGRR